jgi:hypothetical protein
LKKEVIYMKKIVIAFFPSLFLIIAVSRVYATQTPYITICHHNPSQNVTLSFQNVQSYLGHLGTPHNLQVYDTLGDCNNPTPTLSPTQTVTPSPTPHTCEINVEKIAVDCVTPTVTPKVTPTVELSPTITPTSAPSGNIEAHNEAKIAPGCSNLPPIQVKDVWYTDYQIIGGKAQLVLHWGTNPSYGSAHIAYGENKGEWRYAVLNVANNGSFTIGELKPHQTYWFQVAYVNGCAVGNYSRPVDP